MSRRIPHNLKRYDVQTRTTRHKQPGPTPRPRSDTLGRNHSATSNRRMWKWTAPPAPARARSAKRLARRYGQRHSRTKLLSAQFPERTAQRTRCAAAPHRWPERTYNPPVRPALGTTGPSANPQKTRAPTTPTTAARPARPGHRRHPLAPAPRDGPARVGYAVPARVSVDTGAHPVAPCPNCQPHGPRATAVFRLAVRHRPR